MKTKEYSYSITKDQYNYLLPIFGNSGILKTRLLQRSDKYYFIGSNNDHVDMLNRCKFLK